MPQIVWKIAFFFFLISTYRKQLSPFLARIGTFMTMNPFHWSSLAHKHSACMINIVCPIMSNETHNNFPYWVHRQRSLTITKVILHNKIFISLSYANMDNGHTGDREVTLYGTENIFNPNKYITTVRGTFTTSNDKQHMPHCYKLTWMMII